jgi:predicted dehydrogenase
MIDAAIVGLGRWGQILVESVQARSGKIRFAAAVTRTPANAADFARKHGLPIGADYTAVLNDPRIQAVVLATPHSQHAEQIVAAARAGKHVFCEKPFALSRKDAETALAAVAKAKVAVGIGHNRRFAPNMAALKGAIDGGDLGTPIHIESNFSADLAGSAGAWRSSRAESPAGGMTSLGIHSLDAFVHLFGRIREVEARSKRLTLPFDCDDSTMVLVEFANGRTGYLGTVAATASFYETRAYGSKGWAAAREHDKYEIVRTDGKRDARTWDGYGYPGLKTIAAELEAFATAAGGGAPFPVPPDEILHVTAALEAIIASAETRRPVQVA